MAFDISKFELAETARINILDPRGDELQVDGKPVVIVVYGAGSQKFVNAKYKLDNSNTALMRSMLSNKQVKNMALEQTQAQAQFLADCTKELENFPIEGGAIALYSNPKLGYITEQVDKFLGSSENFMQA